MYIRGYKKEDNDEIKRLLESQYKDDVDSIYYFKFGDMKSSKNTIVAIDGDEIVGVGSLWENSFHNNANYIGLIVAQSFRKKGIGSELLKNLRAYENNRNLQGATWSNNLEALRFFNKRGFNVVRKTYEPVYDLSIGLDLQTTSIPDSYRVLSIKDVKLQNNTDKLIEVFKEIYERNHTFNKVSELNYDQWKNIMFNYLNDEGSMAIFKEDNIIAMSLLYYGDDDDTLELGLRGVTNELLPMERDLILNILNKQVQYGIKNNFKFINDEIDNVDSGAMVMESFLDLDKMTSWDTLYLDVNC